MSVLGTHQLPSGLSGVHAVFHVSMLRKCTLDPTHVVDWGKVIFYVDRTFEEGPVRIIDCQEAIKGVVVVQRRGEGNMGTRGHDACHLSFLI